MTTMSKLLNKQLIFRNKCKQIISQIKGLTIKQIKLNGIDATLIMVSNFDGKRYALEIHDWESKTDYNIVVLLSKLFMTF